MTKIVQNPHLIQNKIDYSKVPKEYLQVAEGMETQYMDYMIQQMRKTVHKEEAPSTAENYYNSLVDFERAKIMAKENEGGLKDLILRQILPQHILNRATTKTKNSNLVRNYQNIADQSKIKE